MRAVICSQLTKTKLLKTFPKYEGALLLRKAFSNSGSASENHLHLKTIKLLDRVALSKFNHITSLNSGRSNVQVFQHCIKQICLHTRPN